MVGLIYISYDFQLWWSFQLLVELLFTQLSAFAQWWGIFFTYYCVPVLTCPLWWSVVCWHRPDHSNTAVGLLSTNRTHLFISEQ